MRTMIIVAVGLAVALLFLSIGRLFPSVGVRQAGLVFVALWTFAMIVNLGVGVRHGYTLAEELPILLLNIVPVAAVAVIGAEVLARQT